MQKNTSMAIATLTLIAGLAIGYGIGTNNNNNYGRGMMNGDGPRMNMHQMYGGEMMDDDNMMMGNVGNMSMNAMMMNMSAMLEGKTGDEFDRAFLSEMIVHHQGAVVMAEAALKNAKHQEIKDLAKAIISAQNKEIADMKGWLKSWYNL